MNWGFLKKLFIRADKEDYLLGQTLTQPVPTPGALTRKVCSNCKQDYKEGDRYCRFCGAPMGAPEYLEEVFTTIYGPPPTRRLHKCENCGFEWQTVEIIDDERWCPKCGGSAPVKKEVDLWEDEQK